MENVTFQYNYYVLYCPSNTYISSSFADNMQLIRNFDYENWTQVLDDNKRRLYKIRKLLHLENSNLVSLGLRRQTIFKIQ